MTAVAAVEPVPVEARARRAAVAGDVAFAVVFVPYVAVLVLWLVTGLVPALADSIPALHRRLTAAGQADGWWGEASRRMAEASGRAEHPLRWSLEYLFSTLNLGLALLLVVRRPRDRVARLLAIGMIGTAATFNPQSHSFFRIFGDDPPALLDTAHLLMFHGVSGVAYAYAVVLFPDGRLVPRATGAGRWWLLGFYAVSTLFLALVSLGGSDASHPVFLVGFFGLFIPAVGLAAQTYRARRAASPEVQQQVRLLRGVLAPVLVAGIVILAATGGADGAGGLLVFSGLFAAIPIAVFVGIVKYRLLDIDLVVNRTVVYGMLAGFVAAVYVALVAGLGGVVGDRGNAGFSVLATAVVALAFDPARRRAQRLANRLVYGDRAEPYEVLSTFSARLADAYGVGDVLPRMAQAVGEATGAALVEVLLRVEDEVHPIASWPGPPPSRLPLTVVGQDVPTIAGATCSVAVRHQGELLGLLVITTRRGEPLSAPEDRLVAGLASEAGLVLRNARLTAELQARLDEISNQAEVLRASRARIVTAADAERRRIERDLHDGAQQRFVALAVQLRLACRQAAIDPTGAVALLDRLCADLGAAIQELRDLSHGIYPPLLVDGGLAPAVEAATRRSALPASVEAAVGRHRPEVEAAVYFCCLESLQNTAKHAGEGARVALRIWEEGTEVRFEVADTGVGFDVATYRPGAGLLNMSDRLGAVGGALTVTATPGRGTRIAGTVPLGA